MHVHATMPPIEGGALVVFGDSQSDAGTGSAYSMSSIVGCWSQDMAASAAGARVGQVPPPLGSLVGSPATRPPAVAPWEAATADVNKLAPRWPHFYGRFSTGPVWSEHTAALLGVPLLSYAVAGAQALEDFSYVDLEPLPPGFVEANGHPLVPGLPGQVSDYLNSLPNGTVPDDHIIVVLAGNNDLSEDTPALVITLARNLEREVENLEQAGAKQVFLCTLFGPQLPIVVERNAVA